MKKRKIIFFLAFYFLISTAISLEATISCPNEMEYEEEAECTINVNEVESTYDVKIYLVGENGGVNRIYNGEEFQRADWYAKSLIDSDGSYDIKILIHKEYNGIVEGQFKLRDTDGKIVINEVFEMEVISSNSALDQEEEEKTIEKEKEDNEKSDEEEEQDEEEEETNVKEEESSENNIKITDTESHNLELNTVSKTIINLNDEKDNEERVIYTSKQERIKEYSIYAFMSFLVFIVLLLLYEKIR